MTNNAVGIDISTDFIIFYSKSDVDHNLCVVVSDMISIDQMRFAGCTNDDVGLLTHRFDMIGSCSLITRENCHFVFEELLYEGYANQHTLSDHNSLFSL
jgi:hypothetical protein